MRGGVGQGCPAAASAFVIGINPLLTAIHAKLDIGGGETLSAFADDIAVVLRSISRLNVLNELFREFELASALCLDFKKTVIVPLTSGCPLLAVTAIKAQIGNCACRRLRRPQCRANRHSDWPACWFQRYDHSGCQL